MQTHKLYRILYLINKVSDCLFTLFVSYIESQNCMKRITLGNEPHKWLGSSHLVTWVERSRPDLGSPDRGLSLSLPELLQIGWRCARTHLTVIVQAYVLTRWRSANVFSTSSLWRFPNCHFTLELSFSSILALRLASWLTF